MRPLLLSNQKFYLGGRYSMNVSERGKNLIKSYEGCRLEAYYCPSGVLTIGYGHTGDVYPGQVITQAEADALFDQDIVGYVNSVRAYEDQLNQNQFDALVSFCYKCTLSYRADYNIAETGKGNTDIPDSTTSIQFINANKPAIFTEDLASIREHGAVTLTTYEGTFKGIVAVALDVMTIKDELGSGTETICEVTFKLEDYTGVRYEKQTDLMLVNKLREELRAVLVEKCL